MLGKKILVWTLNIIYKGNTQNEIEVTVGLMYRESILFSYLAHWNILQTRQGTKIEEIS